MSKRHQYCNYLLAAILGLLPFVVLPSQASAQEAPQVAVTHSTYCVKFTNLNQFPDYRFIFQDTIEWNVRLVTHLDCVEYYYGGEPKMYAIKKEEYIKGNILANLDNPNKILVLVNFQHPGNAGATPTEPDPNPVPDQESGETQPGTETTTQQPAPTRIPSTVLSPSFQGVSIVDEVELSFDSETQSFTGQPVFVSYKSLRNGETQRLPLNPDGSRPEPNLHQDNTLLYIGLAIGATLVAGIGGYYVYKSRFATATNLPAKPSNTKIRKAGKLGSK